MSPLPAHWKPLTVTNTAIAAKIHQTLNVHGKFPAKIAFDDMVTVDDLANAANLMISEVLDPALELDTALLTDLACFGWADPMDICQRNDNSLVCRNVHACDACHAAYSFIFEARPVRNRPNPRSAAHYITGARLYFKGQRCQSIQ